MNLGYPLEVPFMGLRNWGLVLITQHWPDGSMDETPIVFTESQAREIARRINAYYGTEDGMTETTTEGVLTQPGADVREIGMQAQPGTPETEADPNRPQVVPADPDGIDTLKPNDPLNAAIAAAAGESLPEQIPETLEQATARATREQEQKAAMEAYISAGVDKALAPAGGSEIVTVGHLRAAIESLLRHLHLDHPENYLPKG